LSKPLLERGFFETTTKWILKTTAMSILKQQRADSAFVSPLPFAR
jgi:hypothetical protein